MQKVKSTNEYKDNFVLDDLSGITCANCLCPVAHSCKGTPCIFESAKKEKMTTRRTYIVFVYLEAIPSPHYKELSPILEFQTSGRPIYIVVKLR